MSFGSVLAVAVQAGGGEPFSINILIQYGILGIILILILMGKLVSGATHDRVLEDNKQLKTENAQMRQAMEDKVIPALTRATDLLTKLTEKSL